MPNLAIILKTEIARVAKKEVKSLVEPLRGLTRTLRRDNAAHKKARASLDHRISALDADHQVIEDFRAEDLYSE